MSMITDMRDKGKLQSMKPIVLSFLLLCSFINVTLSQVDSLDLKIGQMIMIGIGDVTSLAKSDVLSRELAAGKVGGVVLFEKNLAKTRTADSLKLLIRTIKGSRSITPFISIDEEGGRVHRLKERYGFFSPPSAEYLGRLDNADTTLFHARKLARLLRDLGFNLNYAPDVDVAIDPQNTVIVKAGRSFGSPEAVSKHAALTVLAHRQHGIKTVLKHFPGHGSSAGDSHLGVVDVSHTWQLREMLPYDSLIRHGLADAVMIAHIINRRWDSSMLPATLSHKVVSGMLRGLLGFKGVVFSDDMQMKAIADNYGLERAIGLSINSGVDVLMFANTIPEPSGRVNATQIHSIIRKLVENKTIPRWRIDESYTRIMAMKAALR